MLCAVGFVFTTPPSLNQLLLPLPMKPAAFLFAALLLSILEFCASESSASLSPTIALQKRENENAEGTMTASDIQILFSDVDGTLVHYPHNTDEHVVGTEENTIIKLPPSSTGMQGIISSETLRKCQELRRRGKKLVLISGMRSTTLWNRIPYLPRADAYCCEAGGRIFYPVKPGKGLSFKLEHFDGASASGLEAFGLEEDTEWRSKMEATAGVGGFAGNELDGDSSASVVTIGQRKGRLWDYCLELQQEGFVIDTKGYSVCFRANRKQ